MPVQIPCIIVQKPYTYKYKYFKLIKKIDVNLTLNDNIDEEDKTEPLPPPTKF